MNANSTDAHKGRILIVDDGPANLRLLTNMLAEQGLIVHPVSDGKLALRFAQSSRPDLILLDILMPGMDGYQVCEHLKADERTRDIPVIFMSALSEIQDKIRGFEVGGIDYIAKPFQPEEVLARVNAQLILSAMRKQLEEQNTRLQHEIVERKRAEDRINQLNVELEERVRQRTAQLEAANLELSASEARFRGLFENSPISLWEEDFSEGKKYFDALRASGVTDFRAYFDLYPEVVAHCMNMVVINDVNQATLALVRANGKEDLFDGLGQLFVKESFAVFRECLITLAEGQRQFVSDGVHGTLTGERVDVILRLNVIPGYEETLGKVLVSIQDITARKLAEEQNQRQLQRLHTLREIDRIITSSLDLNFTLNTFLEQVIQQLNVDAADVLLYNPHTVTLDFAAGHGLRTHALRHTSLALNHGHAGKVAMERRTLVIPDLSQDPGLFSLSPLLADEGFVSYFGVPLIVKGQIRGVLEIFHRAKLEPNADWLHFLETLAGQVAIAIDNATLFDDLRKSHLELSLAYDTTLEGWARALELRDKETQGHSRNVTEMTLKLAKALGISDARLEHIHRGALLHDIGKMGVPDHILLKPGPLTEEEWEIMRQHPVYAVEMLSPIKFLQPALDIPHFHHEKWDGSGYPYGLKGEAIPQAARIFCIVDVWDALTSKRPYRDAWPKEKVIAYIQKESGKHFDPTIVEAFLQLIASISS